MTRYYLVRDAVWECLTGPEVKTLPIDLVGAKVEDPGRQKAFLQNPAACVEDGPANAVFPHVLMGYYVLVGLFERLQ
jgi:hypothetical protein